MNVIYGRIALFATIHAFEDLPPSQFKERTLCGAVGQVAEAGPQVPAHLSHFLCPKCTLAVHQAIELAAEAWAPDV